MVTKRAKWGVATAILLMIARIIAYPQLKNKFKVFQDAASVVPTSSTSLRNQTFNISAEVLKYQLLTDKVMSTGSTLPDERVDLTFKSSGKTVAIYFTEGSHVKTGDLLVKINDKPLQIQLKKLKVQVPLAKDRVYRQRTLLEKDAVSQEACEQVATEYGKLMADIELVKANIAQTELRAPFDGIIGLRSVSEGVYVTSSSSVITKLTKISSLKIEFSIPENCAAEVQDGTPIPFRTERDGMMQNYKAAVYAAESRVDMATRTLKVRATYPNPGENVLPGRYTSVEISKRKIKDALVIPNEAVIPKMEKDIIYLYRSSVAEPQEITIGIRVESRVQVLQRLNVGDTLIMSGMMQLRTGMKVSTDNLTE